MSEELQVYNTPKESLSLVDVEAQVKLIQQILHSVMQENQHYGKIPGTDKPTLLKAGAEKLCLTFRLEPRYESTEIFDGNHLTVKSICTLYHIPSGNRIAGGEGMCSTKESKYGYRNASRKCPNCDQETIIKGKEEYGGGWLCYKAKGGCGKKFSDGDESIEKQKVGKVPNEYLADQYNTVLKMSNKRSLVAATLNATAASDIFTQDMEDVRPEQEVKREPTFEDTQTKDQSAHTQNGAPILADQKVLDETYKTGKTMITNAKALKSLDASVQWIDSRYAEGKLTLDQAKGLNSLAEQARSKFVNA